MRPSDEHTAFCPGCHQDKPLDTFMAPRNWGPERKELCTPCRRQAAQARRDARTK